MTEEEPERIQEDTERILYHVTPRSSGPAGCPVAGEAWKRAEGWSLQGPAGGGNEF